MINAHLGIFYLNKKVEKLLKKVLTNLKKYVIIYRLENEVCECSSMVEFQPSKLVAWVRFPSLAPNCALSSVDRVPGYEPVGRRFESSRARHQSTLSAC